MGFKKKPTKFLNADLNTHEEIGGAILDKKALPEIRFKFDLFVAHSDLMKAIHTMRYNTSLNNGRSSPQDVARVKGHLCSLFGYLKYMILEKCNFMYKEKMERFKNQWLTFHKINNLYNTSKKVSDKDCYEMCDFLFFWMHELNLTNLLKAEFDPLQDFYNGS